MLVPYAGAGLRGLDPRPTTGFRPPPRPTQPILPPSRTKLTAAEVNAGVKRAKDAIALPITRGVSETSAPTPPQTNLPAPIGANDPALAPPPAAAPAEEAPGMSPLAVVVVAVVVIGGVILIARAV